MSKLKIAEELFKRCHFDRGIVILCVRGIFDSSRVCETSWR
jgi:hypothetical protein